MARFYLGIDGGQSATVALIADAGGRILGRGQGGPCNHVRGAEGREKFFRAVATSLDQACREAELDARTVAFAAACLGFSGGPEDKDAYARELIRSGKYKITHDAEIALSGATAGEPGIIIVAGTGSMAFGCNRQGKTARAGGWGFIFGDEGGAFDLTRRALRAALQFEEGWGKPTLLREMLLDETRTFSANELLHCFYSETPRPAIAALAPLVTNAAEQGDEIATEILRAAARKLVWYVTGVYAQLFQAGEQVVVAYIGGVFRSRPLRRDFSDEVRKSIGCEVAPPRFSPAAGALLQALRLDGNEAELSAVPEADK